MPAPAQSDVSLAALTEGAARAEPGAFRPLGCMRGLGGTLREPPYATLLDCEIAKHQHFPLQVEHRTGAAAEERDQDVRVLG